MCVYYIHKDSNFDFSDLFQILIFLINLEKRENHDYGKCHSVCVSQEMAKNRKYYFRGTFLCHTTVNPCDKAP